MATTPKMTVRGKKVFVDGIEAGQIVGSRHYGRDYVSGGYRFSTAEGWSWDHRCVKAPQWAYFADAIRDLRFAVADGRLVQG